MSAWQWPEPVALPPMEPRTRLLWAGIGGSLLPTSALVDALASPEQRSRFVPLSSPEPKVLALEPDDQVVFASKSGRTLELWTWIGRLRAMPGWKELRQRPIAITQDDGNPLAQLARAEGWPILPIPLHVGGRFSAFTAIGAYPIAWMGLDPARFLAGAQEVCGALQQGREPWAGRVAQAVEAWFGGYLRSLDHWVLLPYANALETVGAWWVQLVAESLGKTSRDGIRRGIIPIRAIGPQDQHAQLQRWLDGPRNVGVVLVTVEGGPDVIASDEPESCPFPGLAGLSGRRILRAQADGTREALEAAGVPILRWDLEPLDEHELGAFLMAWQLIVGITGMALEVDPFDQPAVEDGKRRTLKMLGLT